ncbi:MAG: hypothetical protein R3B84_14690 [Zavarzinella sp.]
MDNWRTIWREGLAPSLSTTGLLALHDALLNDDQRIIQGATTSPPPLRTVRHWPIEASCAIGFCAWQGEGLDTTGEVEDFFTQTCREAEARMGQKAACRWFLNWFDDTPREKMRRELRSEVLRVLHQRGTVVEQQPKRVRKEKVSQPAAV